MFDLPRTSHKYLIEPITEKPHIQFTIMKRFLKFCDQLRSSTKTVLKSMVNICENDTQTKTGNNLRTIMLLTNKNSVTQIKDSDISSSVYNQIPEGEEWRVQLIKELIEAKYNRDILQDFSYDEISAMIDTASIN